MKNIILIFLLIMRLPFAQAASPSTGRHPRVLEIERMLQTDIQTTLRDLIPGQSFHTKVLIEPLHRQTSTASSKETLPYFESSEELKDEWDNPNKTDFELLARVVRISVKASLPSTLTKDQIADIKSAITFRIPYVEGRDLIEIEQRDWPSPAPQNQYTAWILGLGVALMLILGVIYFVISYLSLGRVTKAIKNIKIAPSESSSAPPAMPSFQNANETPRSASAGGMGSGHVQINDTIRMTEVIMGLVQGIETTKSFPTLEDMILIEQYLTLHPSSTGALLAAFPQSLKERAFSMSYSSHWLKSMTNPGEIDATSFELMNKLMRVPRDTRRTDWNELLILCWRLHTQLPSFLRKIPSAHSLMILQELPRALSIQAAREAMPGEWAVVLKPTALKSVLSEEEIAKYTAMAKEVCAPRALTMLEHYKRDLDLLELLKVSDPAFEKEIYGAAPPESTLETLRPPFFKVLELGASECNEFVPLVSLEDWSFALLNIPRQARANLDAAFSPKQRLRLSELFKRNDKAGVGAEVIGSARERIARARHQFVTVQSLKAQEPQTTSELEAA